MGLWDAQKKKLGLDRRDNSSTPTTWNEARATLPNRVDNPVQNTWDSLGLGRTLERLPTAQDEIVRWQSRDLNARDAARLNIAKQ